MKVFLRVKRRVQFSPWFGCAEQNELTIKNETTLNFLKSELNTYRTSPPGAETTTRRAFGGERGVFVV